MFFSLINRNEDRESWVGAEGYKNNLHVIKSTCVKLVVVVVAITKTKKLYIYFCSQIYWIFILWAILKWEILFLLLVLVLFANNKNASLLYLLLNDYLAFTYLTTNANKQTNNLIDIYTYIQTFKHTYLHIRATFYMEMCIISFLDLMNKKSVFILIFLNDFFLFVLKIKHFFLLNRFLHSLHPRVLSFKQIYILTNRFILALGYRYINNVTHGFIHVCSLKRNKHKMKYNGKKWTDYELVGLWLVNLIAVVVIILLYICGLSGHCHFCLILFLLLFIIIEFSFL